MDEETPPVSIVVLPDTQYYALSYPEVFTEQTNWIISHKTTLNIALVLHVGDLVEDSLQTGEWSVASSAMHLLDGIVPYVVVPGNHDTDEGNKNPSLARETPINEYFGPSKMPWVTGTMSAGRIENNFALVDIGTRQWLVLGMEFGPRDAAISWADAVLKAYPDRPTILLTHAYLCVDASGIPGRYDLAVGGVDSTSKDYQSWFPAYYGLTPSEGINDGEDLWQKLVLPNPNVRLVFSGHQTPSTGGARLSSQRPDGSTVHQMLSDYQWLYGSDFGYGYLRVVQFDYSQRAIRVTTYSPYLDNYLTDDANQFTLDLNF